MNKYAQTGPHKTTNTLAPSPWSRHSLHFVRDFVDVDAAVIGFLLVITIPALRESECGGKQGTDHQEIGGDQKEWEGREIARRDDYGQDGV